MLELTLVQKITVWVLPVLFAVTLHEVAHGWVACKLGDPTAKMLGRVSFNPFKHVDPIGTIILPMSLLALGGIIFGWAKPVPITWQNLKHPRRDMALVSLAGPVANLLMALLWGLLAKLGLICLGYWDYMGLSLLVLMGKAGLLINIMLMALNLLPLPPLDGGRIFMSLLPKRAAAAYSRIEPYGFFILLALVLLPPNAPSLLSYLLSPCVAFLLTLSSQILGLA
jgi:Zn-dependent protease